MAEQSESSAWWQNQEELALAAGCFLVAVGLVPVAGGEVGRAAKTNLWVKAAQIITPIFKSLKRVQAEPRLPAERKLIAGCPILGVVLRAILVRVSRRFFPF